MPQLKIIFCYINNLPWCELTPHSSCAYNGGLEVNVFNLILAKSL